MDDQDKLKKILKKQGKSLTAPRKAVFETLQKSEEPVKTAELARLLKHVDRASVYRTIELFETLGIVNRVWSGFKSKIELSDKFSPHHHHFTCQNCGCVIELESEALENNLNELEKRYKFDFTYHSIELNGRCVDCKPLS